MLRCILVIKVTQEDKTETTNNLQLFSFPQLLLTESGLLSADTVNYPSRYIMPFRTKLVMRGAGGPCFRYWVEYSKNEF